MAATAGKLRWGDTLDDDDLNYLPPTQISGPDARGTKTITEYKKNDKGETVKVTTRIRVVKIEKKQYDVRYLPVGENYCRLNCLHETLCCSRLLT